MPHFARRAAPGIFLAFVMATSASAETSAGGRGGPFFQIHTTSLNQFDSELRGNPVIIGGVGLGNAGRNLRIGGGGGGAFLLNPSDNVQFGMGYGGIVGGYGIASWLSARLLIGAGGYSVNKITSQTQATITTDRLASGGFFLFYPSVHADIPLTSMMKLNVGIGYFIPNVQRLQSFAVTLGLIFGRI
jgi:hypothetical protein